MTTTYYINSIAIVSTAAIGVSVERYHSADYWAIRLYLQDTFTNAITSSLLPNTTGIIEIIDTLGTTTFSGTISYWASSVDYSYVDLVNCNMAYVTAP